MASQHSLLNNGDCGSGSKLTKTMSDHSNTGPPTKLEISGDSKSCSDGFTLGKLINEGKTKIVYDINSEIPGSCLLVSKDIITAHNAAMKNFMEGKAVYSTATNAVVMKILNDFGVKTAFIKTVNDKTFLAKKCDMIPIEWVARRVATGSFLKRN